MAAELPPQGGLAPWPHSAGWSRSGPAGLRGSSSPQRSEDDQLGRDRASPHRPCPTSWQRGLLPPGKASSELTLPSSITAASQRCASPCPTSQSSGNPPGVQQRPHSSRGSTATFPSRARGAAAQIRLWQLHGMDGPRTVWWLWSHRRQGWTQHQGCHLQMSQLQKLPLAYMQGNSARRAQNHICPAQQQQSRTGDEELGQPRAAAATCSS